MTIAHDFIGDINGAFGDWVPQDYSVRREIKEPSVLVLSDCHIPYCKPELLALARQTVREHNVQCVLWLGDFMDMHKFSSYGTTDHSISWPEEKAIASNILMQFARDLETTGGYQMVSRGNHDHRWIKKLDNHENMEGLVCSISPEVADLVNTGQLTTSDNPTVVGVPVNGLPTWLFTHPAQFKAPFRTPGEMAMRENLHVVSAHAHHFGFTTDPTGKYWAVESGGLFDDKSFEYVQRSPTTMRAMVHGFWLIEAGQLPRGYTSAMADKLLRPHFATTSTITVLNTDKLPAVG